MLAGLFLDPTENIKWITIVSSGCGITSTPVYIWMATLKILRRSEKCRQEFPLVPDAPCNSAIINPAEALQQCPPPAAAVSAHGPQLSRIVLWELVTGATEFYATQPARLRIIIYLWLINIVFIWKYCSPSEIIVFSYFTYLNKYFFVTYFFPQGNRSSVSQTAEILLQITEALMFLHTLHYLHCRYPLSRYINIYNYQFIYYLL